MLDTIAYKFIEGAVIKTVTHVENVDWIALEITALNSQLAAFKEGEQTSEIIAAVVNYTEQLTFLNNLGK